MAKTKEKTRRAKKMAANKVIRAGGPKRVKRAKAVEFVNADTGAPIATGGNPFSGKREARSETKTFRMTRTELESLNALACRIELATLAKTDAVEAIRQGLALLIEKYPPPKD